MRGGGGFLTGYLDGIVWILGDESHLDEAAHGSVGLGLLLVVHGNVGHVILPVHRHLATTQVQLETRSWKRALKVNFKKRNRNNGVPDPNTDTHWYGFPGSKSELAKRNRTQQLWNWQKLTLIKLLLNPKLVKKCTMLCFKTFMKIP